MNKKIVKIASAFVLSSVLFSGCAKAPKGSLVKIGDVYITEEQVIAESNKIIGSLSDEDKKAYDESTEEGKAQKNNLNQRILDNLTENQIIRQKMKLLYEKAKKDNVGEEELNSYTVTEKEVTEQFNKIKEQVGGDEKLKEELEKYKISEDELKKQIEDQEYNKKFQIWFNKSFEPSQEEINSKYAGSQFEGPEIEASHILVETKEDAVKIKERLNNGEKLEEIAKDVSKDPSAQTNNGKLGKFTKGVMVPEFYEAASNLKVGEISEPVQSQYGFHIIQVNGVETEYDKFTEEGKQSIASRIRHSILQEKFKEEFEAIKKELGVLPIKSFK